MFFAHSQTIDFPAIPDISHTRLYMYIIHIQLFTRFKIKDRFFFYKRFDNAVSLLNQ